MARIVAWGDDTFGQMNVPSSVTNAVAIASGYYHGLALVPFMSALQAHLTRNGLVIQWNGAGVLQWAPTPTGPYTDVPAREIHGQTWRCPLPQNSSDYGGDNAKVLAPQRPIYLSSNRESGLGRSKSPKMQFTLSPSFFCIYRWHAIHCQSCHLSIRDDSRAGGTNHCGGHQCRTWLRHRIFRVLVSNGTYFENLNFIGKAITVTSVNGPQVTTIDGSHSGPVVLFETAESAGSVIKGFTIQYGYSTFGSGMALSWASPTIISNIFQNNEEYSGYYGAAIGGNASSAIIEQNLFRNNTTDGQDYPVLLPSLTTRRLQLPTMCF